MVSAAVAVWLSLLPASHISEFVRPPHNSLHHNFTLHSQRATLTRTQGSSPQLPLCWRWNFPSRCYGSWNKPFPVEPPAFRGQEATLSLQHSLPALCFLAVFSVPLFDNHSWSQMWMSGAFSVSKPEPNVALGSPRRTTSLFQWHSSPFPEAL